MEDEFVGKDVAEILGYSNTKAAIATHVDEEDRSVIQRSENTTLEIPNIGLAVIKGLCGALGNYTMKGV